MLIDDYDTTDSFFSYLYDFDVTKDDPDGDNDGAIERHAWPCEYYQSTIDCLIDESNANSCLPWGINLAVESGNYTSIDEWKETNNLYYPPGSSSREGLCVLKFNVC